jgi:hypothetical protein
VVDPTKYRADRLRFLRFLRELAACHDLEAVRRVARVGEPGSVYLDCWAQFDRVTTGSPFDMDDDAVRDFLRRWVRECRDACAIDEVTAARIARHLDPDGPRRGQRGRP